MSVDDDISNRELLYKITEAQMKSEERISDSRIASEERTKDHIDTINEKVELLIHKSITDYHEENNKAISDMFPNDHTDDHSFITMVRSNFRSFMNGLFGTLGKVVLFLIMMGIVLQIATVGDIIKIDNVKHSQHMEILD